MQSMNGVLTKKYKNDGLYYSLQAPQSMNVALSGSKIYNFTLFNCTATNASLSNSLSFTNGVYTTPVVFSADGARIQFNYKASQLTNSSTAIANNSQRKVVRTSDGAIHMVYESMKKIGRASCRERV